MHILVVDDSKVMRSIVTRTLRQAGFDSYDIHEAENGRAGLDAALAQPPLLVLSDWNMPEMSGIEFLAGLRDAGSTVPFGFVTSEGSDEMRGRAQSAGASFLIAKPFTADTFRDALAEVLS